MSTGIKVSFTVVSHQHRTSLSASHSLIMSTPLPFSGLRPSLDPVHHCLNTSSFSLLNAASPQIKCSNPPSAFATLSIDQKSINNEPHVTVLDKSKIPDPDINNSGTLPPDSNNSQTKIANHVNALPQILHAPQPSDLNLADLISLNSGPSLPATACNIADSLITSFLTPSQLNPSVDPHLQLAGNCSPVSETPPTPCNIVRGSLPSDLNGVYLRNGPNATRLHQREGYHMFDGDGMLHSVRFKDGNATFCARYVKTSRFRQEEAARRPLFPKFFGALNGVAGAARTAVTVLRAGLGLLNVTEGWGLSNTSVGFFNGQVLSMSEDDMPYVVKVTDGGDLITTGNFKLPFKMNMCAHPKFDAATGEMFAFSFNPPFVPPFSFFRVSADGVKSPDVPVPLMDIPLVHDFAITRRYVIFPDSQLVVRPTEFLKGEMPVVCDAGKTSRFCLLPRYALPEEAAQKARWFEAPGCNCLHYLNAWEEGPDEVVLITPVLSPAERILELPAVNTSCTLSEIRFNTSTGRAYCRKVCSGNFEFGTVNQKYVGRKAKYAYLAGGCYPKLTGVVKVNLQSPSTEIDAVVGRREFGENCYGNEPFFVPRNINDGSSAVAEDDGYLVCFVHNEATGVSELLVMDALSPSLEVIAAVQLPSRVPYGFHGWFVSEQQLAKQA